MSCFLTEYGIHLNFFEKCTENCILHFVTHITPNIEMYIPEGDQKVYSTAYNICILENQFKVDPERLVAMSLLSPVKFVRDDPEFEVYVTLLDANYAPGCAMILLEAEAFGTILYTGNFCYEPALIEPFIFRYLCKKRLSRLYVDTRSLKWNNSALAKYDVVEKVVNIIRNNPEQRIYILLQQAFKSDILIKIQCKLKEPIYVSAEKMEIVKQMQLQSGFVTDPKATRVHVVDLRRNMDEQMLKEVNTVYIILTTAFVRTAMKEKLQRTGVHVYCYRTRSLPEELKLLINKLKPEKVMALMDANNAMLQGFLSENNNQCVNKKLDDRNDRQSLDVSSSACSNCPSNVLTENNKVPAESVGQLTSFSEDCCVGSLQNGKRKLDTFCQTCDETESNNPPLNLKCAVSVRNIVESVNFFNRIGLKPTWKNSALYKSPERDTKLGRQKRRKKDVNEGNES